MVGFLIPLSCLLRPEKSRRPSIRALIFAPKPDARRRRCWYQGATSAQGGGIRSSPADADDFGMRALVDAESQSFVLIEKGLEVEEVIGPVIVTQEQISCP